MGIFCSSALRASVTLVLVLATTGTASAQSRAAELIRRVAERALRGSTSSSQSVGHVRTESTAAARARSLRGNQANRAQRVDDFNTHPGASMSNTFAQRGLERERAALVRDQERLHQRQNELRNQHATPARRPASRLGTVMRFTPRPGLGIRPIGMR